MKYFSQIVALFFFFVACHHSNDQIEVNQKVNNKIIKDTIWNFTSKTPMVFIQSGKYQPLYGAKNQEVKVNSFLIDVFPVTNQEFKDFIVSHPNWRKSKVKKLFADKNYMFAWHNDTILPYHLEKNAPITNISWYAAKAYCDCQGKRLPTVDEWEYVAMADESRKDARRKDAFNKQIISQYEKPKTYLNSIGQNPKNVWGVYDLHGLVWEWTSDFNSVMITGESRNDFETDNNLFCGSESVNSTDLMNYAAFMRYAFRGSIKADYSVQNLGFRCVKDSLVNKK
jgi:formylglycine-generating enzyme required for sulfatase activity